MEAVESFIRILLASLVTAQENDRLSLARCREILKNPKLTDEEVLAYRDEMYALVQRFFDEYFRNKRS